MADAPHHPEHRPDRLSRLEDLSPGHRELVEAALEARRNARPTYSDFAVGAAVRGSNGLVVPGCNVEISSYSLTLCAERVALFAAVARGVEAFEAVGVVGPGHRGRPTSPCGACRQVIWDLCGDCDVILAAPEGACTVWKASELLPEAFGPLHLEDRP